MVAVDCLCWSFLVLEVVVVVVVGSPFFLLFANRCAIDSLLTIHPSIHPGRKDNSDDDHYDYVVVVVVAVAVVCIIVTNRHASFVVSICHLAAMARCL